MNGPVQMFSDPSDEGEEKLGDATVAGGKFSLALPLDKLQLGVLFLNATVTDPAGNTSEFGHE